MTLLSLGLALGAWLDPRPEARLRLERLGEQLFADPRLSVDGSVACASCHVPERGFVDNLESPVGVHRRRGPRNTPTVLNAFLQSTLFWDGRASTLEEQALGPLLNPKEMGLADAAALTAVVRAIPSYRLELTALFDSSWDSGEVLLAIAAYERTLGALSAPFDRYLQGDEAALSDAARQGWSLFNGKGRCKLCHAIDPKTRLFTDQSFHNLGVGAAGEGYVPLAKRAADLGRFLLTQQASDHGGFRTPDLRNSGITAPYMHDGSMATLWDVMDHYNRGGDPNPRLDAKMRRLEFSENEIDALVAFMFCLTDDRYASLNAKALQEQTARKDTRPERE